MTRARDLADSADKDITGTLTVDAIDVQGTVTADGLTVDGASVFNQAASDQSGGAAVKANGTAYGTNKSIHAYMNTSNSAKSLIYAENGAGSVFNVDGAGDISFYDSTGVTQGLFWDASTQRLGLGTTSPSAPINIEFNNSGNSSVTTATIGTSSIVLNDADTGGGYRNLGLVLKTGAGEGVFYGAHRTSSNNISAVIGTNDTERLRIDEDGNVGIGTSSPAAPLTVNHATLAGVRCEVSGSLRGGFQAGSSDAIIYAYASNPIKFAQSNGGSERMRIDSSGNLLVGKTILGLSAIGGEVQADGRIRATRSGGAVLYLNRTDSDGTLAAFYRSGTLEGSISITTSGTTYNTTSDIRLKENIEPLEATDKLMAMNPVSYNWKADPDGPRSMGFIAQEMQEVMPEAVAVGDDEDAMMSMDYGRITPILVSALQDAHRKIDELAAELAELKAK